MIQLDDVPLVLCDQDRHFRQLTGFIRKQGGYGKDPIPENESLLDHGRHGDHVHITAAEDAGNILALRRQVRRRRHRQQSGVLHDHFMVLDHVQESDDDLVIRNGHDFIQIILQVWEDLLSRCPDRGPFTDSIDGRQGHDLPGFQRLLHAIRSSGFYPDDLDIGVDDLGHGGYAGRQTAAAHRHQNGIHKRKLFDDLHAHGTLTGSHRQVIERMDVGVIVLLAHSYCTFIRIVVTVSVQDHFRPVALGTIDLDQRGGLGHHDDGPNAKGFRRIGDPLCVVAGRSGNQAPFAFFFRETADLIIRAPDLICTGDLHVLRLQIDPVPGPVAEVFAFNQFGLLRDLFHHAARLVKIISVHPFLLSSFIYL